MATSSRALFRRHQQVMHRRAVALARSFLQTMRGQLTSRPPTPDTDQTPDKIQLSVEGLIAPMANVYGLSKSSPVTTDPYGVFNAARAAILAGVKGDTEEILTREIQGMPAKLMAEEMHERAMKHALRPTARPGAAGYRQRDLITQLAKQQMLRDIAPTSKGILRTEDFQHLRRKPQWQEAAE